MTVGVGFQCPDGVVLAADRQITKQGGLKYERRKILSAWTLGDVRINCSCTYATDSVDLVQVVFKDIAKEVRSGIKKEIATDTFQLMIENVLSKRKAKNVEMLIGFSSIDNMGFSPLLMYAHGLTVRQAQRQFIGVGDSSVLQYIAELLQRANCSVQQAKWVAIYMVSLANRFIDQCQGGPDVVTMHSGGRVEMCQKNEIKDLEKKLSDIDAGLTASLLKVL